MDRRIAEKGRLATHWKVAAAALGALGLGVLLLGNVTSSVPTIKLASVVTDEVRFGELEKTITGPGKLVPTQERIIAARSRAMVERVVQIPGTELTTGDRILNLTNPDVDLALLEARREFSAAEADLVGLRARLDQLVLDQEALIKRLKFERLDAERVASAYEGLAQRSAVSDLDLRRAQDSLVELGELIEIEEQKKTFLVESRTAQLESQIAKNHQLRNLVEFRERLAAGLSVTAPIDGVLQELAVEEGEWVQAGDVLARIVEPGALMASLKMPQTNADELLPGQPVSVDTRIGIVKGHVRRVDPLVKDGAVIVEALLDDPLPAGARAELTVYGTIHAGLVGSTLSIRRPPNAVEHTRGLLFRVDAESSTATRVQVAFGESTGERIEVLEGVDEGNLIIVSDTETWDQYSHIELEL